MKEKDKKKGSGVRLLVDQDWIHHMGACKKFNSYLLKAEFYFRKVMLQVWIAYIPPKNEEIAKKVHKIILEELIKNKKNTFHIVMGDFNAILNRELDTSSKGKRIQDANSKIIRWLKNTDHIETFRFCNSDTIKFSWSNGRITTRID